ncbi:MAG: hypothetical protein R6V61_13045, partial [Wenzhouxiangellaceae bacterium]
RISPIRACSRRRGASSKTPRASTIDGTGPNYAVMVAGIGRSGHAEAMTRNMATIRAIQEPKP